jgi:hypothetical protein
MAVSDRVAAAVTHRRSWAIALLIAVGAGVFIALAGPNSGADKGSAAVAAGCRISKGGSIIEDISRRGSTAGDPGGIPPRKSGKIH